MFRVVLTGEISDVERKTLDGGKIVTNFTIEAEGVRVRGSAWAENAKLVPNGGKALVEGRLAGREYQNNEGQTRRSLDLTVTTIESLGAPKAAAAPPEDFGGF